MTHRLSQAWIIGFLLAVHRTTIYCEGKVKRQLNEGTVITYRSVPKTSFTCDLVGPGYYADMETQCQIFHVCHASRMDSFICPEGTMFNQKVFVCDWRSNVDCDSSPDFYSLNSRIGTDQPFHASVFIRIPSGGSTIATIGDATARLDGIEFDTAPAPQLGSQSQARVKAVRPETTTGKQRGDVTTTSNIRVGNTLLPNTLFVEVPTFVTNEPERGDIPTTERSEPPAEAPAKSASASGSSQNVLSRGREGEKKKKNETYGPRIREEGYLPANTQNPGGETGEGVPYFEGSGDVASKERAGYPPTEVSNAVSTSDRGSYLPEETAENRPSSSTGSYLPEEDAEQPRSSSNRAESPPQAAVTDASFLLPPPSAPEVPNSILGAFVLQAVDEEDGSSSPTRPAARLSPSDEPAPLTEDDRPPSTTESFEISDEAEEVAASPTVPSRSRQGFGRAIGRGPNAGERGRNSIQGDKTTKKPATQAPTTTAAPAFQYDFDSVRSTLQERLRNVEPFDVPAQTMATPGGQTAALPRRDSRSGGPELTPWLHSLARVPM